MGTKLGVLVLLMAIVSLAMAQESRRAAESPAEKPAESAESAESAEKRAGGEGGGGDEAFVPTEKVPADASIAFPVDI